MFDVRLYSNQKKKKSKDLEFLVMKTLINGRIILLDSKLLTPFFRSFT